MTISMRWVRLVVLACHLWACGGGDGSGHRGSPEPAEGGAAGEAPEGTERGTSSESSSGGASAGTDGGSAASGSGGSSGSGGGSAGEPTTSPNVPSGCESALPRARYATFYEAVSCLFTGDQAIQVGVETGAISPERVVVLRGRVLDSAGEGIAGVEVRVGQHPEFGRTLTREAGYFDLAANGGGQLSLRFEKDGYVSSFRHQATGWRRFHNLRDLVLVERREPLEPLVLDGAEELGLRRGAFSSDADGERSHALVFRPGTKAFAKTADGAREELPELDLRITEVTTGDVGSASMPAELPPTSAFTYAVELTAVQAEELEATSIEFDTPVINYVDNFLEFPAGTPVPAGYYNEAKHQWEAADSGVVIDILGVDGDLALLDTDGDDEVDGDDALAALGIDSDERRLLASEYGEGASLWRVELQHFSLWDFNWPFGPPPGAIAPNGGLLGPWGPPDPCGTTVPGSIIHCDNQALGELLPIVGTPYTLHYQSARMAGRRDGHVLDVALSSETIPESLKRIELEIEVMGQVTRASFEPEPNLVHRWVWDGRDAWGRSWQGWHPGEVRIGFVYQGSYESTERFGQTGTTLIEGSRTREEITLWQRRPVSVGGSDFSDQGLAGWTLDVHHTYDREGGMLHLGTGEWRAANRIGQTIETIAGSGKRGFEGDGGPALEATFDEPQGLVIAADGTAYVSDAANHRVRRILPDGSIDTYAGTGATEPLGDGGPATEAAVWEPAGLALRPDGTLVIVERGSKRIREVSPDGIITTIAGGGDAPNTANDIPATDATFSDPYAVALGDDGSLFITDTSRSLVRKISPDGLIATVAGGGTYEPTDGVRGTQLSLIAPAGIAIDEQGTLYVASRYWHRVVGIDSSGIARVVAGTGVSGFSGDGGPATEAELDTPNGVHVSSEGVLYIIDQNNHRVRRIDGSGHIDTIAGTGEQHDRGASGGDRGSALRATFIRPSSATVHPDGSLWVLDTLDGRIRRIAAPLPGYAAGTSWIASSDGSELYEFDRHGQHSRTVDALTGLTRQSFEYEENRLIAIEDTWGNRTTVHRESGAPIGIEGPYGAYTSLEVDDGGLLSAVSNPAGETTELDYTEGGLLTLLVDPGDPETELHTFEYDGLGRLTRDTSPTGRAQTLEAVRSPGRQVITLKQNGARARSFERSFGGRATDRSSISLDEAGFERRVDVDATGAFVTTSIDSRLTEILGDPRFGGQSAYAARTTYWPNDTLEHVTETQRSVVLEDNDPLSLLEATTTRSVNGAQWVTHYDALSRTETLTSPEGRVTLTQFDATGLPVRIELPTGAAISYSYDARGRLTALTTADGTWDYAYADNGTLASITNPLGEVTEFRHDAAQRPIAITFGGATTEFGYDRNGSLTSVAPPGQPAHLSGYAPGKLLQSYLPPGGAADEFQMSYGYNDFGELASVMDPTGDSVDTSYDAAGRIARVTHGWDDIVYSYVPSSHQVQSIAATDATLSYTYDGALLTRVDVSGDISGTTEFSTDAQLRTSALGLADGTLAFSYDDDGLLTQVGPLTLEPDAGGQLVGTTLQSVEDLLGYDALGQQTSYAAAAADSLYQLSDTRDALGRIVSRDEYLLGAAAHYEFSYDGQGRLTRVSKDGAPHESYTYDDNGNRLSTATAAGSVTADYDLQDRLLRYGSTTYEYTGAGDLARRTDGQGTTDYAYDRRGNLRQVNLPDGTRIEYLIDGLDRRVGKRVDGSLVHGFLYKDQLNPVAQLDPDGTTVVASFAYGTKPHVPDFMLKGGQYYRFVTDQVGSVRLVVNAATGEVAQRIDYTAFGVVTTDTNPGFQPFGFAGGLYDADTGLVRFGARDYDPEVGRWTAKDPLGFVNSGNLYVYALNDAINWYDPTGELVWAMCAAGAAVGGALGGLGALGGQTLPNAVRAARGRRARINWWAVGAGAALGAAGGCASAGGVGFLGLGPSLQAATNNALGWRAGALAGAGLAAVDEDDPECE